MKKLNSKGFGVVEVILVVVILGLLGGLGYYVFNQNKNTKKEDTTIAQTKTENPPKDYVPAANTTTQEISELNIKFDVPNTWKQKSSDVSSTQKNYILVSWIANGVEVRLSAAKASECPQGDGSPLSYYQGYYAKSGINYLNWCPQEDSHPGGPYPVGEKNSVETVNIGKALYLEGTSGCDGLSCSDEQVKDGEKIYSFTSVFNVKSDQGYPGATFYHLTVGNAEAAKTTNAELVNVLKSLRSIK